MKLILRGNYIVSDKTNCGSDYCSMTGCDYPYCADVHHEYETEDQALCAAIRMGNVYDTNDNIIKDSYNLSERVKQLLGSDYCGPDRIVALQQVRIARLHSTVSNYAWYAEIYIHPVPVVLELKATRNMICKDPESFIISMTDFAGLPWLYLTAQKIASGQIDVRYGSV